MELSATGLTHITTQQSQRLCQTYILDVGILKGNLCVDPFVWENNFVSYTIQAQAVNITI